MRRDAERGREMIGLFGWKNNDGGCRQRGETAGTPLHVTPIRVGPFGAGHIRVYPFRWVFSQGTAPRP